MDHSAASANTATPLVLYPEDTVYLSHSELTYVKLSEKNRYFTLGCIGMDPFRLYKNVAQQFLGKLSLGLKEAVILEETLKSKSRTPLADSSYYEAAISDNVDKKTGIRYQLRIVASVFNSKPYLGLRSYVYLADKKMWHPTQRGIRFAIDEAEVNTIRAFINEKLSRQPCSPNGNLDAAAVIATNAPVAAAGQNEQDHQF